MKALLLISAGRAGDAVVFVSISQVALLA